MAITPEDHDQHKDALTYILNRFNEIEMQLAGCLIEAIGIPENKRIFSYRVLFNNAILPFSQKVKLLFNLREEMNWDKVDAKPFHRLGHIRNQIAHCLPRSYVSIYESENGEELEQFLRVMLESIDNNGKLKPTTVEEALREFKEHESNILEYLNKIKG